MGKRQDDDGFAEYCRVFVAAKVDYSMPFEQRLARMIVFQATERLEQQLDLGDRKLAEYTPEVT